MSAANTATSANLTTPDIRDSIRASRLRVARSRGMLSGVLLLVLGAWAAVVPFIGPYFDFAFTPAPGSAWHWDAARGWFEVLPGAVAVFGGLLLIVSASRVVTTFGSWIAAAAGAWLIVGPAVGTQLNLGGLGAPNPASSSGVRVLESLFFFYAIGAAILFVASVALGRLSVHSVRDVRAAERRTAGVAAAEQSRAAEQSQADEQSQAAEQSQAHEQSRAAEQSPTEADGGRHLAPVGSTPSAAAETSTASERSTAPEPPAASAQPEVSGQQGDGRTTDGSTRQFPTASVPPETVTE